MYKYLLKLSLIYLDMKMLFVMRISKHKSVCVPLCVCVYVCVFVWERERERESLYLSMNRDTFAATQRQPLSPVIASKGSMDFNSTKDRLPKDYCLNCFNFQNSLISVFSKVSTYIVSMKSFHSVYASSHTCPKFFTMFFISSIKLMARYESILFTFVFLCRDDRS